MLVQKAIWYICRHPARGGLITCGAANCQQSSGVIVKPQQYIRIRHIGSDDRGAFYLDMQRDQSKAQLKGGCAGQDQGKDWYDA